MPPAVPTKLTASLPQLSAVAPGESDYLYAMVCYTPLHGDPDLHLLSVRALEPMVDLFSNVFPQDVRSGEIGLLPNGQIPGLGMFVGEEPRPKDN